MTRGDTRNRKETWLLLGGIALLLAASAAIAVLPPLREGLLAASELLYEAMQAVAVACRIR